MDGLHHDLLHWAANFQRMIEEQNKKLCDIVDKHFKKNEDKMSDMQNDIQYKGKEEDAV